MTLQAGNHGIAGRALITAVAAASAAAIGFADGAKVVVVDLGCDRR
jgi:hypothetical protein